MSWAALIISIVAILVAGASAFYTRSQARSAHSQAQSALTQTEIEKARDHKTRRPVITIDPLALPGEGRWSTMTMRNKSLIILHPVTVSVVQGPDASAIAGINYIPTGNTVKSVDLDAPFGAGTAMRLEVAFRNPPRDSSAVIRFDVQAQGTDERWTIDVDVDIPSDVTESVH